MWQALIGSLFRIDFYKAELQEPIGKAVRYFLLLSLILGTLMGFKLIFWVMSGVNEVVETFNDSFPEFVIENGRLEVEGKMPYVVFRLENEAIVIVDTSGQTTKEALANYKGGLLFNQTAMINKQSDGEFSQTEFSRLKGTKITKADVAGILPVLKWVSIVVFAAGLAYYFATQLLSLLVTTVLIFLIAWAMKKRLSFRLACHLSLYALTLSCLLETARFCLALNLPGYGIFYYGLPLVYAVQVLNHKEA